MQGGDDKLCRHLRYSINLAYDCFLCSSCYSLAGNKKMYNEQLNEALNLHVICSNHTL